MTDETIWEKINLFPLFMLVLVIGVVSFVVWSVEDMSNLDDATKQSCEKIGMEYDYRLKSQFCIDEDNQAHYVKINCERISWINHDCTARIITIGDNRVVIKNV